MSLATGWGDRPWLDRVVRRGGGARGKGRGHTESITSFLSPPAVSPFRGLEEPPRCPARSRRPDLSPGAAHDLEVVIDEANNGKQTLIVVVKAAAEDHRADNVGHGAAEHKRGVEGLA